MNTLGSTSPAASPTTRSRSLGETVSREHLDVTALRRAYSRYPSGVVAVCALVGDQPLGMAASSFTTVSLEPALVSMCVQNGSATWPRLREHGHLGLSVLGGDQDEVCRGLSTKHGDRFAGVRWESDEWGALFVHGAALWMGCALYDEVPAGDHTIVLLQVCELRTDPAKEPLVFHGSRFRRLAPL